MTGERSHPTRNSPDMQIMHILYSCYPFHIGYQLWHINAFRNRFKQNIRCLTHNAPSSYSNETCNSNRKDRVNDCPASKQNDEARNNDTYGCSHITKDMQSRRTRIEVIPFFLQTKSD